MGADVVGAGLAQLLEALGVGAAFDEQGAERFGVDSVEVDGHLRWEDFFAALATEHDERKAVEGGLHVNEPRAFPLAGHAEEGGGAQGAIDPRGVGGLSLVEVAEGADAFVADAGIAADDGEAGAGSGAAEPAERLDEERAALAPPVLADEEQVGFVPAALDRAGIVAVAGGRLDPEAVAGDAGPVEGAGGPLAVGPDDVAAFEEGLLAGHGAFERAVASAGEAVGFGVAGKGGRGPDGDLGVGHEPRVRVRDGADSDLDDGVVRGELVLQGAEPLAGAVDAFGKEAPVFVGARAALAERRVKVERAVERVVPAAHVAIDPGGEMAAALQLGEEVEGDAGVGAGGGGIAEGDAEDLERGAHGDHAWRRVKGL